MEPSDTPGRSNDPGASQPKITTVQDQVSDVANVLQENITKLLERGHKLDHLEDRSEMLSSRSEDFRATSRRMARKVWWANMKVNLVIGAIALGIIILLYFFIGH